MQRLAFDKTLSIFNKIRKKYLRSWKWNRKSSSLYIRVVLILGIFEFLCCPRLRCFEINKKKNFPKFQAPISILTFAPERCMVSFSFKWHRVFGIEQSIFNSVQKIWNFNLIIVSYLSGFLRIFSYYNFGVTAR